MFERNACARGSFNGRLKRGHDFRFLSADGYAVNLTEVFKRAACNHRAGRVGERIAVGAVQNVVGARKVDKDYAERNAQKQGRFVFFHDGKVNQQATHRDHKQQSPDAEMIVFVISEIICDETRAVPKVLK